MAFQIQRNIRSDAAALTDVDFVIDLLDMPTAAPIIESLRAAFTASGLTLDQLGTKMGYKGDVARKSAWQFLNKTADPRLSMLRRFADALGVPLGDLLTEPPPAKPKKVKAA